MSTRRSIVRGVAGLAAVAAIGTASGCATFNANNAAATVEGTDVPRERFERVLRVLSENSETTGIQPDLQTVSVSGEAARPLLASLIADTANELFLEANGESITDADRQQVLAAVDPQSPALDLPADVLDILVDLQAAAAARTRIDAPDRAALQRRYSADPASTGLVCMRHILVATESEALNVRAELATGADFATLAAERSTEPGAAESGGSLPASTGSACQPLGLAVQSYDPAFMAGAIEAHPGQPAGPVETQFGWHVIDMLPFDEVGGAVDELYAQAAGDLLYDGFMLRADITVDPRYGSWDSLTRNVVPLST